MLKSGPGEGKSNEKEILWYMITSVMKAPNFDVKIMMKIFLHKFDSNEDIFLE